MTEHKPAEINQDALRAAAETATVYFGRNQNAWSAAKDIIEAYVAALPQEGAAVAPVDVLLGFCSYRDGTFELAIQNQKTGEETLLSGTLSKPLAEVDKILPTCVFVPAKLAAAPSPAAGVDAVQVAVLAEREACAKFVEDWQRPTRQDLPCCECGNVDRQDAQETFAAAIRARPLPCP